MIQTSLNSDIVDAYNKPSVSRSNLKPPTKPLPRLKPIKSSRYQSDNHRQQSGREQRLVFKQHHLAGNNIIVRFRRFVWLPFSRSTSFKSNPSSPPHSKPYARRGDAQWAADGKGCTLA
jgi:hypothetical protein